jgi:hypothetical protein
VNSKLRTFVVVGAIAVSAALWFLLRGHSEPNPGASTGAGNPHQQLPDSVVPRTNSTQGELSSGQTQSAVQPAPPVAPNPSPGGQTAQSGNRQLSLPQRYDTATDKRKLFEELKASESSESPYFAAKILLDCRDVSLKGFNLVINDFIANIPDNSPAKATQVEAFRRLKEPCSGFDGRRISIEEIQQKYAEGVQKSDPRAIARTLMTGQIEPNSDPIRLAVLLLQKADPYVISEVAGFMAGPVGGGVVIDGKPVDLINISAANTAWQLVACDYGGSCGPNSAAVLNACANRGVCGMASFDELVRTAILTLDDYQRALQYRLQIEAALQNKDYVSLGLGPGRRPRTKG